MRTRHRIARPVTLAVTVGVLALVPALRAQAPFEMSRTDKIELFLQHLGKVAQVEPQIYQSFLLEYELAQTLAELGTAHPEPLLGEFLHRSLGKLYPEYAAAAEQVAAGERAGAQPVYTELMTKGDPFLTARCRLALAEIELAEGRHEGAIRLAEEIVRKDRQFLLPDYRACEIIAAGFEALDRPVLEYLQHAILLTDFRDVPPAVEARAKERLAALEEKAGRPMQTVAGWMDRVEELVRAFETAEDPTQRQQGQILIALDKMIELQEARERNACKNCGSGSCNGSCKGGRPRGNRSSSPAQTSQLADGDPSINLRGVSRGNASSLWGLLKDRQGASALQSSKVKLPERYQRLLEQYYRGLSRGADAEQE